MMENKEKTTRLDGQKEIFEALRQEVQKLCTVDDKVEIQEMVKNNNVVKLGMTIQEQGKPVSPLIYLEPYLRSLNEGTAIEETAQSIYAVHRKCRGQELAAANEFFQAELNICVIGKSMKIHFGNGQAGIRPDGFRLL